MIQIDLIKEIINNCIEGKNLFLVEIKINPSNKIVIRIDSMNGITIGECARISREVENKLDEVIDNFELEISSPGLTEPFKVFDQYKKNIGRVIEITTHTGEKRKGKLLSANNKFIEIDEERIERDHKKKKRILNETKRISFDQIKSGKIVLNF